MPLFLHCFYFRSYQPITKIFPCCTSKKNIGRTWFQIVLESPLEEYEENQQKKQSGIKAFISIWIKALNTLGEYLELDHIRLRYGGTHSPWQGHTWVWPEWGEGGEEEAATEQTGPPSTELCSRLSTAVHSFFSYIMFKKKSFQRYVPFYWKIQQSDAHFFM